MRPELAVKIQMTIAVIVIVSVLSKFFCTYLYERILIIINVSMVWQRSLRCVNISP
jgi:hypothetical protein